MDSIHSLVIEALLRPGSKLVVFTKVDASRDRPPASKEVQQNRMNCLGILDSPVIGHEDKAAYVISLDKGKPVGVYWLDEIIPAQLSLW